jgi:hypothetical protein
MKRAITVIAILLNLSALAQEKLPIVQQAMRDEIERNMKELKSEGFDKPFFINYTLLDETTIQMTATLGALMNSIEAKNRQALSLRLLVGDYDFNDESLDNNLTTPPQANEINLPIDDDYLGIRRSLWISTDNVYRSASRQFAKNKEMLKEQNKPLADVPHRSFAKVAISNVDIELPEVKFDKAATEDYVRKVSAVFSDYANGDNKIDNSNVTFFYRKGYRYLANSEGSINRVPVSIATIVVAAGLRTSEGEFVFDNIQHIYATPELPPLEKMIESAKQLAERLIEKSKAPSFTEDYIGPVLFEDSQVGQLILEQLFGGEDNLIAKNNIPSLKGINFDPKSSVESKIGKSLFAEGMTIKATPKLKKFGEQPLLGSFDVDDEGVVPPDETLLVENGVLKTVMNDRTLISATQVANGLGDGPGVVTVSFKTTTPAATMKSKLIAQAKKQGLDYALLMKNSADVGRVVDVYRVYVADGREELVRQASMKDLSQRDFRKILEVSKEMSAHNIGRGSAPVSIICPQSILLEEVEFTPMRMPTLQEQEYVSSPLRK